MTKISRMSGTSCAHHHLGRCLYEESLNPGYNQVWQCRLLCSWEEDYDVFLNRAEAFGLDEDSAAQLWNKRLSRLMEDKRKCPDFVPGNAEHETGCIYAAEYLCLKCLPECQGRCQNYSARNEINPERTLGR